MHKCINQKQAIDDHQTEPCDLVQSEPEESQNNDNHNEDKEEEETKFGMWWNFVLSTLQGYLQGWVSDTRNTSLEIKCMSPEEGFHEQKTKHQQPLGNEPRVMT